MKQFIAIIILSLGIGLGLGYIPLDNFLHIGWYQFGLIMLLSLVGCIFEYFRSKKKKEKEPEYVFALLILVGIIYASVFLVFSCTNHITWGNEHYRMTMECMVCGSNTVVYQEKGKFWGELDNEHCYNCGLQLDVTKHPDYQEKLDIFKSLRGNGNSQ